MTNKIYCSDTLETVKTLPDESIDCVITSPPYYQLRDYGWNGQWGLEKTYQEYLDKLISLVSELKRVLKPTGTMWINLGDSYGGNSGGMGLTDKNRPNGGQPVGGAGRNKTMDFIQQKNGVNKSLMLIPHRFAIRCIDELGLILRNDVIWAKRNGMPESVTDRFSKKHEYFFFMVKQQKYYFDLDGVRDNVKIESVKRFLRGNSDTHKYANADMLPEGVHCPTMKQPRAYRGYADLEQEIQNTNGKNPGDVSDFWDIPTKPSKEKHYASYNTDLIDKPIIAGCPEFVCKKCGKPREKIIKTESIKAVRENYNEQPNGQGQQSSSGWKPPITEIKGLTDCGCNAGFESGIILDPFCGTGTTILRATQLGRSGIGIDGSKEYCEIANKRIDDFNKQIALEL